jgi:formylmethanofuran:tetrahydromethanopterin formyltransferase
MKINNVEIDETFAEGFGIVWLQNIDYSKNNGAS